MVGGLEAVAIKNLQTLLISRGVSAESLFSKYDIDGDGSLSYDEFSGALSSITGQTAPAAIVRAIVDALDTDGDGALDLNEIISLVESNSDDEYSSGSGVSVSDHPNDFYNGNFEPQQDINGKPSFRNPNGAILYFYNAGSGGAPSWSMDDREQDGSNDWYRGGWTRVPSSGGLPIGTRRWVGVGKITISSDAQGSFESSPTLDDSNHLEDDAVRSESEGAHGIEISLAKAIYLSSEEISFTFTAPELPNDAWVGIVPSEIPHGNEAVNDEHDTSFRYLEGRTRGDFSLSNPGPGEWTLRLHDSDNNGNEIAYVPFTVSGGGAHPSISIVSGDRVPLDEPLVISFSGSDTSETAWIGIYGEGGAHEHHNGNWKYLNGHQSPPSFLTPEGKMTFQTSDMFDTPGRYQARLFADNGYEMVAQARFELVEARVELGIDDVTSEMAEMLNLIDPQSRSIEAIEAGRAKADAEVEQKISQLPFTLQPAARRIWNSRADAYQDVVVSKLPSPDALAAGVAAAGIAAAAISSSTRESAPSYEPEPPAAPEPEPPAAPEPEPPAAPEPEPPAAPEPEPPAAPEPNPSDVSQGPLSEVVQSFTQARLMSDQKRLIEAHSGTSHYVSFRISSLEKTFGIGLSEEFRGGSTIIAEIKDIGEAEIRLHPSADTGEFRTGYEGSMTVSVQGWNAIRKRIILGASD